MLFRLQRFSRLPEYQLRILGLEARGRMLVRETGMDVAHALAQVKGELGAESRQSKTTGLWPRPQMNSGWPI
jgi:hypothetical protein